MKSVGVASKLPRVGTTIFTHMSALAQKAGAINLSQGYPDFSSHPDLFALVEEGMQSGLNQYAPLAGVLALRERLAEKYEGIYGVNYHPESEVTITAGGTQAIFTAIMATVREGDEVILFTPAYDSYAPSVELAGGRPIFVQMKAPYYNIDWDEVKKVLTHRTRMIIINTPHNPTGSILSAEDMVRLEKLLDGSDTLVLSDEVYEHMVFDGYEHQSACRFPGLRERSFIIGSFGKTFHNTGWKVGYCLAPAKLSEEFRKVHQYVVFSVNHPVQYAFSQVLQRKELWEEISGFYQAKRDKFNQLLKGSRFVIRPSAGTYFQILDYSKISQESDVVLAEKWTKEIGVAGIPISGFYHTPPNDHVIRFCFAKSDQTLEQAAERLCKL